MRIHHLELTAFGPFSGTETVDFDKLTDAGLFLLCGPTGAGKTSILDAVCFGLYGEVPGDRNSAKRLRSDHAGPGVVPSVVLEVSINGRRFRIRRSPAWQRPKKRGTGSTTEQPKVNVEEHVDGEWIHLSNRLDETGQLVTDLLGMNVTQFTQVAMLPQGRFQSFLRAKSDERHKVLQQLFRTGRFEDIEKWLVGHRQSLKSENKAHQDAVASVVSRLSEASTADLPDDWDLHELAVPAEEGRVATWTAGLVSSATEAKDRLADSLSKAAGQVQTSRTVLQQARTVAELRDKHHQACGFEKALAEKLPESDKARADLHAARRAANVAPLLRLAKEAASAVGPAQCKVGEMLADAAHRLNSDALSLTPEHLAFAERDANEAAAVANALLPREADLAEAQTLVELTSSSLADLFAEHTEVGERCKAIPVELDDLRTLQSAQGILAANLPSVEQSEQQVVEQLRVASRVADLVVEVEAARASLQVRIDVAQSLREKTHDIREARINGMAAELATALASGGSCPVCGSADHPSPAQPVAGAPTRVDEEQARTAFENADFTRQAQSESVVTLERNLALASQAAGGKSLETLEEEIHEVRARLAACRAAGVEEARLAELVSSLVAKFDQLQKRAAEMLADIARQTKEREHAQVTIEKVSAELSKLFKEGEVADSVARLVEARTEAGSTFARAREALTARDLIVARSAEANEHAVECAQEHGFHTAEAASAAALSAVEMQSLEELLRARDELRAKADAILADPAVQAAMQSEQPDVAALELLASVAEETLTERGAQARVADTRLDRLAKLAVELSAALDAWAPARSAYAVSQTMSTFVDGKGADNGLQMRLSAYVLAARLKQVVAAANERLLTMSDERYTLEHSSARGVGEQRGGLSLLVRDEWTGESRDPATLSGGETFVASLALALGLADVVTQEAGGSNIDTLFIDEGFGTLDPETLDDVMNTLDGLRDGGRVVGVVSHVPEMRIRVPSQLQIRKDRTGSHVVATREAV